jgi:hypothetical protein
LSVGDAAIQSARQQQSEELSQAADARSQALASLLKKPPRYETGNKVRNKDSTATAAPD